MPQGVGVQVPPRAPTNKIGPDIKVQTLFSASGYSDSYPFRLAILGFSILRAIGRSLRAVWRKESAAESDNA